MSTPGSLPSLGSDDDDLSPDQRKETEIIKKNRVKLTEYIHDVAALFPFMKEREVFTKSDCELVKNETTSSARVDRFIDILLTKGPRAVGVFHESLSHHCTHLFNYLCNLFMEAGIELPQERQTVHSAGEGGEERRGEERGGGEGRGGEERGGEEEGRGGEERGGEGRGGGAERRGEERGGKGRGGEGRGGEEGREGRGGEEGRGGAERRGEGRGGEGGEERRGGGEGGEGEKGRGGRGGRGGEKRGGEERRARGEGKGRIANIY